MNELLSVFTAFGVMVAGDNPIAHPILCEKQINAAVEKLVLKEEHGRLPERIQVAHQETSPNSYDVNYKIHSADGSEKNHNYHVKSSTDCKKIAVRKL